MRGWLTGVQLPENVRGGPCIILATPLVYLNLDVIFIRVLGSTLIAATSLFAQDAALARDFYVHGLRTRALESFIELLHNPKAGSTDKSEALYYMGQIAFDENSYSTALDDWQKLIKEYPASRRAVELKDRLTQLQEVFSKATDASIDSIVARSYIKNGDFWFKGDRMYTIDDSWLPDVEMAMVWYDRVIQEFPGTDAAELAFERKLFSLIGYKEPGRDGDRYGLKANYERYLPLVLTTFSQFETAFPKSTSLQAYRYQIAQAYGVPRIGRTRLNG